MPKLWRLLLIFHSLFIIHYSSFAQIGTWQSHVSYQSGQSVAVVANKIYTATQNGLFYYDKSTNETTTLGKTAGLSDIGISRLLYLADQKRLLITYRNGNIDFLTVSDTGEPGTVVNVNIIVTTANLPAFRTINHINRIGNNAYLSTDFGLIVLDVLKNEIRDTYFSLRSDGTPLPIIQTAATADSLYALTAAVIPKETGRRIRAIRFTVGVNIADPANWKQIDVPGLPIESISTNQGRLSATLNNLGVYERQNNKWILTQSLSNAIIRQFPATAGLLLATDKAVTLPGSSPFTGALLTDPREVIADENRVWVADATNGLLAGNAGTFQRIAPDGPTRDLFAQLYTYSQTLIALPAGPRNDTLFSANQPPINVLSVPNDRWANTLIAGLSRSFNSAAYLPTEQRLYLGSFGSGLWSQAEEQPATLVPLPATISTYITSLATDVEGNLWIATGRITTTQATLHVRRPNGQFQSFPSVSQINMVQIVPDDYGFLWIRLDLGSGLFVFDPQTNRSRFLNTLAGQGGLLTNSIRTLAKDRNGSIWVGTDLGPTVFDDPAGVFDGLVDAQPPLVNRRRLLANEVVTAIAVDGGNRKWIGTQTGIYHVAPDGSQLLDTFKSDNSPLPNNLIQAVAIEPVSGKVFIQTGPVGQPNGLVSYQGQATEPTDTLRKLTIFPNPVRPDFTGTVGINGLTENATVKILDAGGQLVYETRSQGGTAAWNLRDYRNRQAQTGVYLVVVVTSDGTESLAGKLAVVR
ncbi:type IX secretion system anionic LPS delivery protein PorZ [Spirosoma endophyticum]|uniref:Por secretion system C-terminal sorting domain-containing protein n=1 Tax=Spirosoma endophyticum TaxID=662367 RepID=A0A1I1PCF4_9BACT|nr:two-component regulator propeller domain-containing protein [Spirosoma endophyticum]SFD04683.1 Por secretion system C-terminal sorting domain-containing protein [Spirosoma endophyticum]